MTDIGPTMVALWEPKAGSARAGWEDGVAYSPSTRRFAVADGASTGQGSREWAFTLTSRFVSDPFVWESDDDRLRSEFGHWLDRVRSGFDRDSEGFPDSNAPSWVQAEGRERGAFATFLAGEIIRDRLRALSVGDCCGFIRRSSGRYSTFPAKSGDGFSMTPELLASKPRSNDDLQRATILDVPFADDDDLLVTSDALAEWFLANVRSSAVWNMLLTIGPTGFRELVADLRADGAMKNDDVTMLRIKGRCR